MAASFFFFFLHFYGISMCANMCVSEFMSFLCLFFGYFSSVLTHSDFFHFFHFCFTSLCLILLILLRGLFSKKIKREWVWMGGEVGKNQEG